MRKSGRPADLAVVTLLYHEVAGRSEESGFKRHSAMPYRQSASTFLDHLEILSKSAVQPTTISQWKPSAGGRSLFLTFDDGGHSAFRAARLVEEKGWRAHFFIVTAFIGTEGFLSSDEILDLHRRGHVIGSHSHRHPDIFYNLSREEMLQEWQTSCEALSEIIQTPIVVASVPGGDMDRRTIETAGEAGIRYLFTSEPVLVPWKHGDTTCLGRFCLRRDTPLKRIEDYANFRTGPGELWLRRSKQAIKRLAAPLYTLLSWQNRLALPSRESRERRPPD